MLVADLTTLERGVTLAVLLLDGAPLIAYYLSWNFCLETASSVGETDGLTGISIGLLLGSLAAFVAQHLLAAAKCLESVQALLTILSIAMACPVWFLIIARAAILSGNWVWRALYVEWPSDSVISLLCVAAILGVRRCLALD